MARPRGMHAVQAREAARLLDAGLNGKETMRLLNIGSRTTLWRLATAFRLAAAGEEGGDVEKVFQKLCRGFVKHPGAGPGQPAGA